MKTYHAVVLTMIDSIPSVKVASFEFESYQDFIRFMQSSGHYLLSVEDSKVEAESTAFKIIKAYETLQFAQSKEKTS